jgi:hypothetical protein
MFSIPQIVVGLLLLVGVASWWIAHGFGRRSLSTQISQTIDALDGSTMHWQGKLDDPALHAYARTQILCNEVDRKELEAMQVRLDAGDRLTVKQVVRLEKLVAEHLVEKSSVARATIAVYGS